MVVAVTLGLALAFEPAEADIMKRQPRDPAAPLLDGFLLWRVIFVSALLLVGVFGYSPGYSNGAAAARHWRGPAPLTCWSWAPPPT